MLSDQAVLRPAVFEQAQPCLRLRPGLRLRTAVELALLDLRQLAAHERDAIRRVNDDLRGALAYTAAVGESSTIAPAVDAVHVAQKCLEELVISRARTSLLEAFNHLSP